MPVGMSWIHSLFLPGYRYLAFADRIACGYTIKSLHSHYHISFHVMKG